jgi:hypothetical protein
MRFGILITDHGTHSAEKWAAALADKIITIAQNLQGEKLIAAQKLQLAISELLVNHHSDHKDEITASLATGTHFETPIVHSPGDRGDQALADVQAAAKGTPWEKSFQDPEIVSQLKFLIGQSLVDLAHVERLDYADKNPDNALAQAYKASPSGILTLHDVL